MTEKQRKQQVRNKRFYYKNLAENKEDWSRRYRKWQKKTKRYADRYKKQWTKEEENTLRIISVNNTDNDIAILLGRTYSAVRSRREKLGIKK